jgi:hypothetical protein
VGEITMARRGENDLFPSPLMVASAIAYPNQSGNNQPDPDWDSSHAVPATDRLLAANIAAELGARANYWIAPARWLTNVPDDVHHGTVYTRDMQYYGRRLPVVGQTILRIARQADSHPRATRVLQLIVNPLF